MSSRLRALAFDLPFYLWTAVMLVLHLPLLLLDRRHTVAAMDRWSGQVLGLLRRTAGIDVRFEGVEHLPQGPFILAAKHQSALDTLVWHRRLGDPAIVLKRELLSIPLYGWYARKVGMLPVDRDARASALRGLLAAARAAAAAGRPIVIFPQGTRTAPGLPVEQAPYRPGVAALYRGLGLPVVPVAVNSGLYWPRRAVRRHPGTAVYRCLPAIPPGLDRAAFQARLIDAIEPATAELEALGRRITQEETP